MKNIKINLLIVLTVLASNIAVDRITKYLALIYLKGKENFSFLYNSIILYYIENTGAFLSLGNNWNISIKYTLLLILPIIVCIVILYHCIFRESNIIKNILIVTIVAGGLSNLFDRVFNHFSVIDFMNFGIGRLRTGVLNVADLSVTFGIILLIIYELKYEKDLKNGRIEKITTKQINTD